MSRRSTLVGLMSLSALAGTCLVVVWFFTREPPLLAQPAAPFAAGDMAGRLEPAPPGAGPERLAALDPAASPSPAPQVLVTPLFDTSTRFERGKTATLRFRAERGTPPEPATGADLSVSVVHVPDRADMRLPVRELGDGVYEADFMPQEPGQFVVAVSSRGRPARTTVPLILGVIGTVGEAADHQEAVVGGRGRGRAASGERSMRR